MLTLRYVFWHFRVRRVRTGLTLLGIALVVGVFCYLLCFADGLRRALARSGDPRNLIVLAAPATGESNSAIMHYEAQRLEGLPQAARSAQGRPLVSLEYVVQTDVARRGDRSRAHASVAIRGVDPEIALLVHRGVELTEGRWFELGTNELVVGATAARQFVPGTLGASIDCGERTFTVVGVFRAGGGVHESEFWGHAANVADAYRRAAFSSATVRLPSAEPAVVAVASERIAAAGIALRAVPESEYFANQTQSARALEGLALVLVTIMGVGAVFAATNTMYAAVAGRTREIGTLRAIGFSGRHIILGVFAESLAIAVGGGVLGCLGCAAAIWLDRSTKDLVGTVTFTSVAFAVGLSTINVVWSLAVAVIIGFVGGIWPARAASRLTIVTALRTV
jgi:putative ABC transport system permease protein